MQVNEFEKNVSDRMEELQLYPSAGVWPEVERRIRKEKRRRWIIFFWLIPVLLGGGTVVYLLLNQGQKNISHTEEKSLVSREKQHIVSEVTLPKPADTVNTNVIIKPESIEKSVPGIITEKTADVKDKFTGPTFKENRQKAVLISKAGQTRKIRRRDDKKEKEIKTPVESGIKNPLITDNTAVVIESKESGVKKMQKDDKIENLVITEANTPVNNLYKTDSTESIPTMKEADIKPPNTSAVSPSSEIIVKKKNKWELGLTLITGLSGRGDGNLNFGSQKNSDAFATPTGGGLSISQAPGKIRNGLFLQTGVYVKKKLGNRTAFSSGLSVSSYTVIQRVGGKQDSSMVILNGDFSSSVTSFYRNGNISSFHNRYYVFSIPLSFHWQINKNNKTPFFWENGLNIGVLSGAKNLVYKPGPDIYYRDDKLVNRFQLSWHTGLYGKFGQSSKHPFMAGLQLNYHFTNLQKVFTDNRNKLFYYGIKIGWVIRK